MKLRTFLGSAALALAFTAPAAQANNFFPEEGSLTGTFQIFNDGGTFAGVGSRSLDLVSPTGNRSNQGTGGFSLQIGDASDGDKFVAWCLDLIGTLNLDNTSNRTYTVNNTNPFDDGSPDIDDTKRGNIQSLFNTAYQGVLDSLASNVASAAFQVALWEIVYETAGTFGVGSGQGAFYVSGGESSAAVITTANGFLNGLNDPTTGPGYNLFFLDAGNNARQDLVTVSPVPLPAAGVLLLAGLGGLVASRKLRRRADA